MIVVEQSTALGAAAPEVWRHATSMDGVNREMGPWLHMEVPDEIRGLTLDDPRVELGEALFASRVLLLGVVPVDRMRVTLVELERGRRFVEQSPMFSVKTWRHERRVEPLTGGACRLSDRVTCEPYVAAALMRLALGAFFRHRHRRLVELFGPA